VATDDNILVATASETTPVDEETITSELRHRGKLRVVPWLGWNEAESDTLSQQMIDADAMIVRTGTVNAHLMDMCENLEVIALHGAGVDQVDVAAASEREIIVTNVPGANARAVAEMTLGLALDLMRRITEGHEALSSGSWEDGLHTGKEMHSLKWGILGMGQIGANVAQLLDTFGTEIIYNDPDPKDEILNKLPDNVCSASKRELLNNSDVISVHVPLTEETTHLLDEQAISMMKDDAYLINVARGEVVDAKAAAAAAHAGKLGGVALDVFANEPAPAEDIEPLVGKRVILTPHLAGSTEESLREIAAKATRDIVRIWRGKEPKRRVN